MHETPVLFWCHMLRILCILCLKFWGIEAMEVRILLKLDITLKLIVVIFKLIQKSFSFFVNLSDFQIS
jgi:hypothetical protein